MLGVIAVAAGDGAHEGVHAAPGEEVRISGGKAVADWQPVSDAVALERLDESVRDKVVQADLKAAGVTHEFVTVPNGPHG